MSGQLKPVGLQRGRWQQARLELDRAAHLLGTLLQHPFQPLHGGAILELQ